MITLPIKRKWFDMIISGVKKEEYRKISKRYTTMFNNAKDENNSFLCKFRNGYSIGSPYCIAHVSVSVGFGDPDFGADENAECYILSILRILEVK